MSSQDLKTETPVNETNTGNVNLMASSADMFNSTDEDTVKLPWRSLTSEKRVEILNRYFESNFNNEKTSKTIRSNTIHMIIELASTGKMKLKKEITYDKVNERVIQIHALVPEIHTDNYVYKPELLIKKEKSKKIARNMLFRKK